MIDGGNRNKTLKEAKLVENRNENPQSFQEIGNYNTMHISNKILSDQRKRTLQRKIIRIN